MRGRQGTGWQRQEASRHGRTGTWGSEGALDSEHGTGGLQS